MRLVSPLANIDYNLSLDDLRGGRADRAQQVAGAGQDRPGAVLAEAETLQQAAYALLL